MATDVFAIQENGALLEMSEAPYVSEDDFQFLLEQYPNLLAGDQIDSSAPRRWLLVKLEMDAPDTKSKGDRWSVDHLFLDQDAVPTLVEVKRSSDTQIRREVVGQMLDYATNAVSYLSAEKIRGFYEQTCKDNGVDAEQHLQEVLDDEETNLETYWQRLQKNLKAGRVRMLFVADHIPNELRRIVSFLNEQMSPAEVLAVEIKQYAGKGLKALVPKVIGQTAQMSKKSTAPRETRQWVEETFLRVLESENGLPALAAIKRLLSWAKQQQLEIAWDKGVKSGSFIPFVITGGQRYRLFRDWSEDSLEIYFKFLRDQTPFSEPDLFAEMLDKLYSIPGIESAKAEWREEFVRIEYATLSEDSLDAFIAFYSWVVARLREGRTNRDF